MPSSAAAVSNAEAPSTKLASGAKAPLSAAEEKRYHGGSHLIKDRLPWARCSEDMLGS